MIFILIQNTDNAYTLYQTENWDIVYILVHTHINRQTHTHTPKHGGVFDPPLVGTHGHDDCDVHYDEIRGAPYDGIHGALLLRVPVRLQLEPEDSHLKKSKTNITFLTFKNTIIYAYKITTINLTRSKVIGRKLNLPRLWADRREKNRPPTSWTWPYS